jgi:hypothetical protein
MMTIPHVRHGSTDEASVPHPGQTEAAPDATALWDFFTTHLAPRLPPRPVIVALAYGPGRVLQTLRERLPQVTLSAYDVTPVLRVPGMPLPETAVRPTLAGRAGPLLPLPIATGTVHLVSLTAVVSRVAAPVSLLAAAHRLLASTGLLWLQDDRRRAPDVLHGPQATRGEDATRAAAFAFLRRGHASPTQQLVVALPTGS